MDTVRSSKPAQLNPAFPSLPDPPGAVSEGLEEEILGLSVRFSTEKPASLL